MEQRRVANVSNVASVSSVSNPSLPDHDNVAVNDHSLLHLTAAMAQNHSSSRSSTHETRTETPLNERSDKREKNDFEP